MVQVHEGKFLQPDTVSPKVFAYLKKVTEELAPHDRVVILTFSEFKFDLFAKIDVEGNNCGEKIPTQMLVPAIRFVYDRTFHLLGTLFFYDEYRTKKHFKFYSDMADCMKLYILALQRINLTVLATVAPCSHTFSCCLKEMCGIPYFNEFIGPLIYKVGGHDIVHIHDPAFVENCYARFFIENDLSFELEGKSYDASILDVRECLQIEKKPLFKKNLTVLDDFTPVEEIGRYYLSSTVCESIQRLYKRHLLPESSFGTALFIKMFKELFEEFYANTRDAKYIIFNQETLSILRNFVTSIRTRNDPDQSPEKPPDKSGAVPRKSKLVRNLQDIDSYVKERQSQLQEEAAVFKENAKKLEKSIYDEMCNTPDYPDEHTTIKTASGKTLTAQTPRGSKRNRKKGKPAIPPDVKKELIKARLAAAAANQPSTPAEKATSNKTVPTVTPPPKKKIPDSTASKNLSFTTDKNNTPGTKKKPEEKFKDSEPQPSTSKAHSPPQASTFEDALSERRVRENNEKNKEESLLPPLSPSTGAIRKKKIAKTKQRRSKAEDQGEPKSVPTNSGDFEVSYMDYDYQLENPIPITVKDLEEALSKVQTTLDSHQATGTAKVDQTPSEKEPQSLAKAICNVDSAENLDLTDFVDFEHMTPSLLSSLISKMSNSVQETFEAIDDKVSEFERQLEMDIDNEMNETLIIISDDHQYEEDLATIEEAEKAQKEVENSEKKVLTQQKINEEENIHQHETETFSIGEAPVQESEEAEGEKSEEYTNVNQIEIITIISYDENVESNEKEGGEQSIKEEDPLELHIITGIQFSEAESTKNVGNELQTQSPTKEEISEGDNNENIKCGEGQDQTEAHTSMKAPEVENSSNNVSYNLEVEKHEEVKNESGDKAEVETSYDQTENVPAFETRMESKEIAEKVVEQPIRTEPLEKNETSAEQEVGSSSQVEEDSNQDKTQTSEETQIPKEDVEVILEANLKLIEEDTELNQEEQFAARQTDFAVEENVRKPDLAKQEPAEEDSNQTRTSEGAVTESTVLEEGHDEKSTQKKGLESEPIKQGEKGEGIPPEEGIGGDEGGTSNLPLSFNDIEIAYIDDDSDESATVERNIKEETSDQRVSSKKDNIIPESVDPVLEKAGKEDTPDDDKYETNSETDSNTEDIPDLIDEAAPIFLAAPKVEDILLSNVYELDDIPELIEDPEAVNSQTEDSSQYQIDNDEIPDLVEDSEPVTPQTEATSQSQINEHEIPELVQDSEPVTSQSGGTSQSQRDRDESTPKAEDSPSDETKTATKPKLGAVKTYSKDSANKENANKVTIDSSTIEQVKASKFDAVIECVKESFGAGEPSAEKKTEKEDKPSGTCVKISWQDRDRSTVKIETIPADQVKTPPKDPFIKTDLRDDETTAIDEKFQKKENLTTVASRLDPNIGQIKPTLTEQVESFMECFKTHYKLVTEKPGESSAKRGKKLSAEDVEDITNWRNYHRFANGLNNLLANISASFPNTLSRIEIFKRVPDDALKLILARRTNPTEHESEILDLYFSVYREYLRDEIMENEQVQEALKSVTRYLDTLAMGTVEVVGFGTKNFYLVRNLWLNNSYGIELIFKKLRKHDSYDELAPDLFRTDHVFQLMEHIYINGNNHECYNFIFDCSPLDLVESFDNLTPKGSVLLVE